MAVERGVNAKSNDLADAGGQIATLEAEFGRQQLDLEFFKKALQRIAESRQPNDRSGTTLSAPKSRR